MSSNFIVASSLFCAVIAAAKEAETTTDASKKEVPVSADTPAGRPLSWYISMAVFLGLVAFMFLFLASLFNMDVRDQNKIDNAV